MREIKFRIWCIDEVNPNGKMYYPDDVIDRGVGNAKYARSFVLGQHGDLYTVPANMEHKDNTWRARWAHSNIHIMFSTGLKDKKRTKEYPEGQEIYEGDILTITQDNGHQIYVKCEWGIHQRCMDSGYRCDIPSFAFKVSNGRATYPIINNYMNKHDLEIMEVIGNIHENPELLENK